MTAGISAFCFWYALLFGMRQPAAAATSLVAAWAWAQAIRILLVEPLLALASIAWAVNVWPSVAPSLAWACPASTRRPVAEALGGRGGSAGALTRRLERLSLVQAAAAAACVPVDLAAVIFAHSLGTLTVGTVQEAAARSSGNQGAEVGMAPAMRRAFTQAMHMRADALSSVPSGCGVVVLSNAAVPVGTVREAC